MNSFFISVVNGSYNLMLNLPLEPNSDSITPVLIIDSESCSWMVTGIPMYFDIDAIDSFPLLTSVDNVALIPFPISLYSDTTRSTIPYRSLTLYTLNPLLVFSYRPWKAIRHFCNDGSESSFDPITMALGKIFTGFSSSTIK